MASSTPSWTDNSPRSQLSSRLHHISALNEIRLMSMPSLRGVDIPLVPLVLLASGAALLICANYITYPPIGWIGCGALAAAIVVYPLERHLKRQLIVRCMGNVLTFIDGLLDFQVALNSYLGGLDKRTSRYFHCVTNTKITTYFMLRQIEWAAAERHRTMAELVLSPTASNYSALLQLLHEDLAFRDGFEFSAGEPHYAPLSKLVPTTLELVSDLEEGLGELEDEIEHYNRQVRPFQEK